MKSVMKNSDMMVMVIVLFLYLILTFEQTNQTEYLKPNYLSTASIEK